MAFLSGGKDWASRHGAPVTVGLMVALVVAFLAAWMLQGAPMPFLALNTASPLPWTLLTYPLADEGDGRALIFFLLLLLMMFWLGSIVERDLGPKKMGILFAALTVLAGLSMYLGSTMLGRAMVLNGAGLPVAGLAVTWGVRYRTQSIMFWGIIPMSGLILACLTVALTLFGYGTGAPLLGIFACLHLGVAALFAMDRIPFFGYSRPVEIPKPTKEQIAREQAFFDDVRRREKEREERERLRKLFEGSLRDDPPPPDR